jgi:glyoxylase-like metal-dependent hydrolase (beta-lactamase superfamily II)
MLERPPFGSIVSADMDPELRRLFVEAGYPPLGEYMIHAVPYAGYDPRSYRLKGAKPTRLIREGEIVDLGDRQFKVYLTPGHSPGSISLFEEATGILFAGDVIYDGPLLYQGFGMNVDDYVRSFELLQSLPITVVHAGHDPSFSKGRLDEIIARYLKRWRSEGLIAKK